VQKVTASTLTAAAVSLQVALPQAASTGHQLVVAVSVSGVTTFPAVSLSGASWTQLGAATSAGTSGVGLFTAPVTTPLSSFLVTLPGGSLPARITVLGGELSGLSASVLDGAVAAAHGNSQVAQLPSAMATANDLVLAVGAFGSTSHAVTLSPAAPYSTQLQFSDNGEGVETVIGVARSTMAFSSIVQYSLASAQPWEFVWAPLKPAP
jgi:hypothetical protein